MFYSDEFIHTADNAYFNFSLGNKAGLFAFAMLTFVLDHAKLLFQQLAV